MKAARERVALAVLARYRHRVWVPLASRLPELLLRWLDHHAPIDRQPEEFNWSFWTDASYLKWARADRKRSITEVTGDTMSRLMQALEKRQGGISDEHTEAYCLGYGDATRDVIAFLVAEVDERPRVASQAVQREFATLDDPARKLMTGHEPCTICGGDGYVMFNYGHTVNPDGSLGGRGIQSIPCHACARPTP